MEAVAVMRDQRRPIGHGRVVGGLQGGAQLRGGNRDRSAFGGPVVETAADAGFAEDVVGRGGWHGCRCNGMSCRVGPRRAGGWSGNGDVCRQGISRSQHGSGPSKCPFVLLAQRFGRCFAGELIGLLDADQFKPASVRAAPDAVPVLLAVVAKVKNAKSGHVW
jgi:hypothetical protein